MSQIRTDLRPYVALLARRWTVIVPAIVLVPLLALVLAAGRNSVYSATAQVLLTYSNPGQTLSGLANPYPGTAPDRNVATQSAMARNPVVARQALALSHVRSTAAELLRDSSVSNPTGSDLLDFTVNAPTPRLAASLATNYARAYTGYRASIDSQAIRNSLDGISAQLTRLAASSGTASATYKTLSHDQQALTAAQASGTSDALLAQPAGGAVQVGPHPARSAAVGLGVGIALAAALVFLMETFDQRVPADEIKDRLRIPLLASIPATRRWSRALRALSGLVNANPQDRSSESLVVLGDANGREAKAFRVLKSRLEFARLEHNFQSLLFTSARHQDSQPETVANLAITFAQAGARILVCDLSAGYPAVGDLFDRHVDLRGRPGVTEVVLGETSLADAIFTIDDAFLAAPLRARRDGGRPRSPLLAPGHRLRGSLGILPFGGPPPHSGFLGTRGIADLMDQLKRDPYDLVLIDAPPLLGSGEGQTLSTLADAVVVALPDPMRASKLAELTATLSRLPVLALGFVTVGMVPAIGISRLWGSVGDRSAPAREPAPLTAIATGQENGSGTPARTLEALRRAAPYADRLRDK